MSTIYAYVINFLQQYLYVGYNKSGDNLFL